MSVILVLAGVGILAVAATAILAVLITGINRGDRRHLANAPRSTSEAFARRLLLGVRCPAPPAESAPEKESVPEKRWPNV